ncbi:hypothetical protein FSP39_003359 [Pinctada imbricata]|uniref:Uncharacterized protein n=1 Tax=Pinctada imbricata TaxID=66713 RepID=A0AA89BPG9_PINIB|nr:hypothetical protein FSP39_003359 [Pinctada imbricata]
MENKQSSKKSQKKLVTPSDKPPKINSSKKKKKNRKSASKADGCKDSDPSPDNLEIEGLGMQESNQGAESDSSHQCQDHVSNTQSTSNKGDLQKEKEEPQSANKPSTSSASLASIPKQDTLNAETKLCNSLSNLTIPKQKSSTTRGITRQKGPITNVQSVNQRQGTYQFGARFAKRINDPHNNSKLVFANKNESLRWDNPAENSEDEEERIRVYKMNRRKRYLAAAQAKGLGWAANYRLNGSPLSEDSGIDTKDTLDTRTKNHNNSRCDGHGSVPDYSPMTSLAPNGAKSGLAMVEC